MTLLALIALTILSPVAARAHLEGAEPDVDGLNPCERAHERVPGVPVNVELATVTDREAVFTWLTCDGMEPLPTDSTVAYSTLDGAAGDVVTIEDPTAFHFVRVRGLKPGTSYRYTVSSDGVAGRPDQYNPGVFTTLTPPSGKKLFSFAALADIHLGEEISGLATSTPTEFPPSYRSDKDYPATMLEAAVADVNQRGVGFTIVPADNSSHGELHQLEQARSLLDALKGDYLIARGAHDRPNQYDKAKEECGADGDCFRVVFRSKVAADTDPQHVPATAQHKGWVFIALDSANLASGTGEISDGQLEWLEQKLQKAEKKKRPAVVFFHHPVAEYGSTVAFPPAVFGVNQEDAQQFLQLIGRYDVRLVVNSHTHRNWISYSPHTGRMPILEVGALKEYPGGYSIFDVYQGGIMRTWHPVSCGFCNEWRERTRGEYLSLYPLYTFGSVRDRNFVHTFGGPDVPGLPTIPLGIWPAVVPGFG